MSAEASGIIARQLSEQGQRLKAETAVLNLASTLRDDSVELLRKEGHIHTFIVNMLMGLAVLPLTVVTRLSVLAEIHPKKIARRYLQYDQARCITRYVNADNLESPVMVFANDGDPSRASNIQIGGWRTTEFLNLNRSRPGKIDPLILCTIDDPRYSSQPLTEDSYGARFDGKRARVLRVADESEMQSYIKLFESIKELGSTAEPVFSFGLPLLKPALGYLPLSPIKN